MCGIAGFLGFCEPELLHSMAQRLAHRGPDGNGEWLDREALVGLAHRRLAIIDTSGAAAQPMAGCGGRYRVSFNGEIYNFKQIGDELRQHGYEFNANSDTAIIAPLYDLLGTKMLERLNGIFAFAIWDRQTRELLLARDAFGVKPLYYSRHRRGFIFASELKAIDCFDELDRAIDVGALRDYLVYQWSPGSRTLFGAVKKLLPGHFIKAGNDRFELCKWHSSKAAFSGARQSSRQVAEQLRELFERAVSRQCLSDVPVGAFLSGGVDSSAIVASMTAAGRTPKQTYCVGFRGKGLADEGFEDDLKYARSVASELGVPLTAIYIEPPTAQDIEKLVWTLDEPQADPAPLYVGQIAQNAQADGIKVLLSGAGGDDIFSGYRRHKVAALRSLAGRFSPLAANVMHRILSPLAKGPFRRRLAKLDYMLSGTDREFLIRSFEFNKKVDALACLSAGTRHKIEQEDEDWLKQKLHESRGQVLLERMLDLEMHGFLPDHNLNYTDKAAMAHGVEVRVPFLDPELVEFAKTLPSGFKTRGLSEKWILKKAVSSLLPAAVINRKKTGFGAPVRLWMAGSLGEMVNDIISSRSFLQRGLFDQEQVVRLHNDVLSGRRDGAYLLLALTMIELWLRRFGAHSRLTNDTSASS